MRIVLESLIGAERAKMIGPIRQECLSGISDARQYAKLRERLHEFDDIPIEREDYELAASSYNTCRSHGIQGSHIDFLICAVAHRSKLLLFTLDDDFKNYAPFIPIRALKP